VPTKKPTPKKGATVTEKVEQVKTEAVVQQAKTFDTDSLANHFTKVSLDVGRKLAEAGNQATAAISTLRGIEQAIEVKRQELKDLYGLADEAVTLDDLRRDIEAQREAWDAETAARAQRLAQDDADLKVARTREREEYEYAKARERRKAQEDFDGHLAAARKAEADRVELMGKDWAAREAALKAMEREVVDLRAAVAGHPAAVKKEADAQVAVATNSLKRGLEMDFALKAKDTATELQLAKAETANCRTEIGRLNQSLAELREQLAQAHRSAQSVAEKALESASGRQSLEVLQSSINREPASAPSGKGR
jgi:phosphopantetheinyl transferase (holo-ACP synthase)